MHISGHFTVLLSGWSWYGHRKAMRTWQTENEGNKYRNQRVCWILGAFTPKNKSVG